MSCQEVVIHMPADELVRCYRGCPDGREKTRWQAIWLLARPDQPLTTAEVADLLGLSRVWVRKLRRRWNASGPQGLSDGRKANGGKDKLSYEQQAPLYEALQGEPDDGGLWSGPN